MEENNLKLETAHQSMLTEQGANNSTVQIEHSVVDPEPPIVEPEHPIIDEPTLPEPKKWKYKIILVGVAVLILLAIILL